MLQLPPLGQASLFLSLSSLSTPLLYCYLAYFVHINISRASWQRPQRPQPALLPPYLHRPCAVPIPKLPRPAGALAARFVVRLKKGRAKGARRGLLGLTCTCSCVCVCELVCVCVCVRRIFRISFLNYASFGLRHLSKYFRNAVSLLATPPPPLSVSHCLCWVSFCILFAIMAALLRGRTGIWGVASA